MNKIVISSDSTCDLSPALVEQYQIQIMPLYVNLGEESFKDGLELKPEGIYGYVEEHRQLPKTAAATIPDYQEFFEKWTAEGYEVKEQVFCCTEQQSTSNPFLLQIEAHHPDGPVMIYCSARDCMLDPKNLIQIFFFNFV